MPIEIPIKTMPWFRIALFGLLAALIVAADDDDGGGGGGGGGAGGGDAAAAAAGLGVTTWADQPPSYGSLQLTLTNSSGQLNPIQYIIVPVITNPHATKSDTANKTVQIDGSMIAADQTNFQQLTQSDVIAYLSCDRPHSRSDTFITANTMLNTLIGNNIKAIVLYSQAMNGCSLGHTDSLQYWNILSMTDAGDAQQVLGYLNGTQNNNRMERVSIVGNASTHDQGSPAGSPGGRSTSAVAMSILYSITGLITLLFLIIIATGAVRAHRYPERYGPRSAVAGRPRQSRAKGLARAVLETIPIVKFNNQQPAKPDPELELDTATMDGRDAASTQRAASDMAEERNPEVTPAIQGDHAGIPEPEAESQQEADGRRSRRGSSLGCSICTEDFKVGEDMRVLPCNHLFHPNCIDPWLMNVSGTCPLCRLDLSGEAHNPNGGSTVNRNSTLPPPLALEGQDGIISSTSHRHGLSRIFDINRLRQASAEEQMAALRQMRRSETEQGLPGVGAGAQAGAAAGAGTEAEAEAEAELDGEERGQRARLTAKLKDTFRIRTRARSPDRRND